MQTLTQSRACHQTASRRRDEQLGRDHRPCHEIPIPQRTTVSELRAVVADSALREVGLCELGARRSRSPPDRWQHTFRKAEDELDDPRSLALPDWSRWPGRPTPSSHGPPAGTADGRRRSAVHGGRSGVSLWTVLHRPARRARHHRRPPRRRPLGRGRELTWMADSGVPVHVLRVIAGHGSLTTTQRYLHPGHRNISDAGEALTAYPAGCGGGADSPARRPPSAKDPDGRSIDVRPPRAAAIASTCSAARSHSYRAGKPALGRGGGRRAGSTALPARGRQTSLMVEIRPIDGRFLDADRAPTAPPRVVCATLRACRALTAS